MLAIALANKLARIAWAVLARGRSYQPRIVLKRASASRTSGEWREDDFDVLADGVVVGRIMKAEAAPVGTPWMWTLAFGHHEDRTPTHGYAATREAAMEAFAKSWRRPNIIPRCAVESFQPPSDDSFS
jgi:hypothetical protein